MQNTFRLFGTAVALGVCVSICAPLMAQAQNVPMRDQLIGTWSFVQTVGYRQDGTGFDVFGANPNGILIFHPDGHFALLNMRRGRTAFASGNRNQGTEEENRMAVQGSIAYFGTYTVDEATPAFTLQIVGCTFPNYEGTNQKRPFTIDGDTLRTINPSPTLGGRPLDLVLKRNN